MLDYDTNYFMVTTDAAGNNVVTPDSTTFTASTGGTQFYLWGEDPTSDPNGSQITGRRTERTPVKVAQAAAVVVNNHKEVFAFEGFCGFPIGWAEGNDKPPSIDPKTGNPDTQGLPGVMSGRLSITGGQRQSLVQLPARSRRPIRPATLHGTITPVISSARLLPNSLLRKSPRPSKAILTTRSLFSVTAMAAMPPGRSQTG